MGGSSSGVSKADIDSLKISVTKLKSDLSKLQTDSTDPSAKIAKTIDYKSLADKIMEIDSYKEGLASKIADNPGKLGDELGEKLGASNTIKTSLGIALEGNTKFAETLAGVLTDTSKTYYKNIRGAKGEAGSLSGSKDVLKQNLHDTGYTMWCADGDYCVLPSGKKGLKLGNWHFEQHPNGNLHIHQGTLDDWSAAITPKQLHAREGLHIHNGQLHLPDAWSIGQNGGGDYLRFNKHGDVKGAVHEGGCYWGRCYGDRLLHDWDGFVRTDRTYELRDQNTQGRHCIDAGSNGRGCNWDNPWQRFSIVKTPHNRND